MILPPLVFPAQRHTHKHTHENTEQREQKFMDRWVDVHTNLMITYTTFVTILLNRHESWVVFTFFSITVFL